MRRLAVVLLAVLAVVNTEAAAKSKQKAAVSPSYCYAEKDGTRESWFRLTRVGTGLKVEMVGIDAGDTEQPDTKNDTRIAAAVPSAGPDVWKLKDEDGVRGVFTFFKERAGKRVKGILGDPILDLHLDDPDMHVTLRLTDLASFDRALQREAQVKARRGNGAGP